MSEAAKEQGYLIVTKEPVVGNEFSFRALGKREARKFFNERVKESRTAGSKYHGCTVTLYVGDKKGLVVEDHVYANNIPSPSAEAKLLLSSQLEDSPNYKGLRILVASYLIRKPVHQPERVVLLEVLGAFKVAIQGIPDGLSPCYLRRVQEFKFRDKSERKLVLGIAMYVFDHLFLEHDIEDTIC